MLLNSIKTGTVNIGLPLPITAMTRQNAALYNANTLAFESLAFSEGVLKKNTPSDPTATPTYFYHYYLTDHLGSTRMAIADDGTVVEAKMYQPYGHMDDVGTGPMMEVRERFTGKELDAEGTLKGAPGIQLSYFGARYYDFENGLWTACDRKNQFWSSYSYTNNPINVIDPDGKQCITLMTIPSGSAWAQDPLSAERRLTFDRGFWSVAGLAVGGMGSISSGKVFIEALMSKSSFSYLQAASAAAGFMFNLAFTAMSWKSLNKTIMGDFSKTEPQLNMPEPLQSIYNVGDAAYSLIVERNPKPLFDLGVQKAIEGILNTESSTDFQESVILDDKPFPQDATATSR